MDAPSYGFGYGDVVAVRVEPGFGVVDFSEVVVTSTFEDVAVVDVDPRVSLTWAAWKRETFVFAGAVGLLAAAEGGKGRVGRTGRRRGRYGRVPVRVPRRRRVWCGSAICCRACTLQRLTAPDISNRIRIYFILKPHQ